MQRDQRLSTILCWSCAAQPGYGARAAAQLVDIIADLPDAAGRWAALRALAALRDELSEGDREQLLAAAQRRGQERRARRFLFGRESQKEPRGGVDRGAGEAKGEPLFAGPAGTHLAAAERPARPMDQQQPDQEALHDQKLSSAARGASQISTLIERIENFRAQQSPPSPAASPPAPDRRHWASDRLGRITSGHDALGVEPPARLEAAEVEDRQELSASLDNHLPFSGLRLGGGQAGRLVSGEPQFDGGGSFSGYRGTVRPDRQVEAAGLEPGQVAEVAHELRTPLNAVLGYAQMIEQQVLGPVPEDVRRDAHEVIRDARQLLQAVDALGDAAALDEGQLQAAMVELTSPKPLLNRLEKEFSDLFESYGVELEIEGEEDAVLTGQPEALYRGFSGLLTALLANAEPGETIHVFAAGSEVSMSRPHMLAGRSEASLMNDPPVRSRKAEAPLLGLSFTLQLLRRLAETGGGSLQISRDRFVFISRAQSGRYAAEAL